MGSYANFCCGRHLVAIANRKYFGYIEDDEFEKTRSYQFLKELCGDDVMYANVSYIHGFCDMTYFQMLTFMQVYMLDFYGLSNDAEHDDKFHEMWGTITLPENPQLKTYQLYFD